MVYRKLESMGCLEWEMAKGHILPCLAPAGWDCWMMEGMEPLAYSSFLDLSIYYYIRLEDDDSSKVNIIWITPAVLTDWSISIQTLKKQAMENMDGYAIHPVSQLIPGDGSSLEGEDPIPLYVLTNQKTFFGAAGILNKSMVSAFAKEMGRNLYIIPSSVHEVLLFPDFGQMDTKDLDQMVKEVNDTQVEPYDRLSGHVYYYDRVKDEIQIKG